MVAWLAYAPVQARRWRPIRGKEFAQRTGCRIDEFFQAERGDCVAHAAPGRIVVEGDPGERGFEQVHVRVRALRQSPAAILEKATAWMSVELRQRLAQRQCLPAPAACFPEGAVPTRIREQREGLIVEVELRFDRPSVKIDQGHNGGVGGHEMLAEVFKCVARCLAPGTIPAQPAGLAIRESLACEDSRPVRLRQRSAIEVDRLVEAAPNVVGAVLPPQRQGHIEQPVLERRGLVPEVVHIVDPVR